MIKYKEGQEPAFLLLCRIYILADYLAIEDPRDNIIEGLCEIRTLGLERAFSAIGPAAIQTVFQNTREELQLQKSVLEELTESLVHKTNGRPVEAYTECFSAIEGFGPMIMKRVMTYQGNLPAYPRW